jgi:hypothetical protein
MCGEFSFPVLSAQLKLPRLNSLIVNEMRRIGVMVMIRHAGFGPTFAIVMPPVTMEDHNGVGHAGEDHNGVGHAGLKMRAVCLPR